MQQDFSILRDVEIRLHALAEARRLRPSVAAALAHLHAAKAEAVQAALGSLLEQQYFREAAEASERLWAFQAALAREEAELRRTAYLVGLLVDETAGPGRTPGG